MTQEQMAAEIARLKAENEALALTAKKAKVQSTHGLKVSEKGALSLYGLGRFPITLYPKQWEKVFEMEDIIKGFIETNRDKFTEKV